MKLLKFKNKSQALKGNQENEDVGLRAILWIIVWKMDS